MRSFFLLLAIAVMINADGYGAPQARGSIAPAPAPYGAPYSSNQVVAMPQVVQQYQPYTGLSHQPIPMGIQQVGIPMGYSMYSNAPQQLNQNPYQLYERNSQVPNSLYVNYPQQGVNYPQQGLQFVQHHQQQVAASPQTSTVLASPPTASSPPPSAVVAAVPPTAGTAFLSSSGTTLTSAVGLTPAAPVDPWASLSAAVVPKKIETRKKKNSEGL
ncbi:hypothetical protein COOONC_15519 [Cooperia oncophora]